jgi:4-amino-4-deoxy-L-arabinose transferase-like glycosyltransferase
MKNPSRAHNNLTALGLVLIAAALRVYGIDWGLPQVYEEATPLYKAWDMWGWGARESLDLNPHFFNYPSLSFYLQFLGQGVLYLVLKVFGVVDSTLDYRVLYVLDKTSFYIIGRAITAAFGVMTVLLTYATARRFMGHMMSTAIALLLAIAPFHISKSQVVEVDIPVTCLIMLTLWFAIGMLRDTTKKNYIHAGLAMGLAMSMKYTAAMLVFPLLTAHIFAKYASQQWLHAKTLPQERPPAWNLFFITLLCALIAFLLTSPFVLLDLPAFINDFSFERQHMQIGHFGLDETSSWYFYLQSLANKLMGWPLVLLAVTGFIYLGIIRKRPWALVLTAFLVPFLIAVASWAMRADRYILPILPVALLLAGGMLSEIFTMKKLTQAPRRWRLGITAIVLIITAAPLIAAFPSHLNRLERDTRTLAKQWIESNIPSGSFIVMEHYGPELFGAKELTKLPSDVRQEILSRKIQTRLFAVQILPLLHIPEQSGVYYDLSLYKDADYIITSDGVKSRYVKEPTRFPAHVAFYDGLDKNLRKTRVFRPQGGSGPTLTVYKNPKQNFPFAERQKVNGPALLRPSADKEYRGEEFFLENLGFNYQTFKYHKEALICFEMAFQFPIVQPTIRTNLTLGRTQCLIALDRREEAIRILEKAAAATSLPAEREQYNQLRQRILTRQQRSR